MNRIHIPDRVTKVLRHRSGPPPDPLSANPNSLYAAGSVGGATERNQLPVMPPMTNAERAALRDQVAGDSLEREPDVEIRPSGKRAPATSIPRPPARDSSAALAMALRSPSALRRAVLLKEVLDPPVALRHE
jgi:hypothetical protein